jgi:hypothetical protein
MFPTFSYQVYHNPSTHDELYYTTETIQNHSNFLQGTMAGCHKILQIWAHDHIALHTSLEPQSKFLSHTVNECTRDGLVPTVLTTKIVVATINMVEIGNSKVSGMP